MCNTKISQGIICITTLCICSVVIYYVRHHQQCEHDARELLINSQVSAEVIKYFRDGSNTQYEDLEAGAHAPSWDYTARATRGCSQWVDTATRVHLTLNCHPPVDVPPTGVSLQQARNAFYSLLKRSEVECWKYRGVGNGWFMCNTGVYRLQKGNCLIYSYGIDTDWSFDDELGNKYQCDVRSFDPSINKPDHRHGPHVLFYDRGLSGQDREENKQNWTMQTLGSTLRELGHHNRTIDILKFDVEYCEWRAIDRMLTAGSLRRVKQLLMEVHPTKNDLHHYRYFTRILNGLANAGFERWYYWTIGHTWSGFKVIHNNHSRYYFPQTNLYFINTNFLKLLS